MLGLGSLVCPNCGYNIARNLEVAYRTGECPECCSSLSRDEVRDALYTQRLNGFLDRALPLAVLTGLAAASKIETWQAFGLGLAVLFVFGVLGWWVYNKISPIR